METVAVWGDESEWLSQAALTARKNLWAGQWWHTLLIPALRRQRWENFYKFEADVVYRMNSRIARGTQREPVL